MISLFDLRETQDSKMIDDVQLLFNVPLNIIRFGDQPVRACTGCWSCWLKTPGKCAMNDGMTAHYHDYVNSDQVILLFDTAQGFINHQAKAFLDRTIPHYHPYIEIINQECHHVARYDRYPDFIFYFNADGLTKLEEQVIEDYLVRTAFHFKSRSSRIVNDNGYQLKPLNPTKAKRPTVPIVSSNPIERLTIYNGSPRRTGSNSALILEQVNVVFNDKVEIRDLKEKDNWDDWAKSFPDDENVLFFMPLYVHAMPSHVMAFLEKLPSSDGSIGFFIQSGFPESSQSHYLEAYFEQLSQRLGRTYLGTAIKGGVESLQTRSAKSKQSLVSAIVQSLEHLLNEGNFIQADLNRLAMPVQLGGLISTLIHLFGEKSINSFWDQKLKVNGAYESRFDRPY